jgi:glyoxylase-like metal-dependent hydrolase (beta-lactamase superfamily II)
MRPNAIIALLLFVFASPAAFAQADLSGSWRQLHHEDQPERGGGPDIGDYMGLPINDAARVRADTWDAAKWTVPEHQCEPHPADYSPNFGSLEIDREIHPVTREITAWHIVNSWMLPRHTIWMDGRAHPPPGAPHTWEGFATGHWEGDTLVATTTHLKEGWVRRNGIPRSDQAVLTEYWTRHGDYLTLFSIVEDPVYLTEPFMRSWSWRYDPGYRITPYPCAIRTEIDRPKGFVAHWLPGTNPLLMEYQQRMDLPAEAVRGGAHTLYPEYRQGVAAARDVVAVEPLIANDTEELYLWPVKGNVHVLFGAGANITLQIGPDGVLLADTGSEEMSEQVLEFVRRLTDGPIRNIINTNHREEHTGGNQAIRFAGTNVGNTGTRGRYEGATIMATENVLTWMSMQTGADEIPVGRWPTDVYFTDSMELVFNDEAIRILHQPAAVTNGDSIVYFRGSDVVSTGDVFSPTRYPVIDIDNGGSIRGVIAALNNIIEITIPERNQQGGTMVVPGHGRITDEYEVVNYRDMLTIIADRVASMIDEGMSLRQVIRAGPSLDYDGMYGSNTGDWTTEMFLTAVYESLSEGR